MHVKVFDTHVRTRDGRYLHFDVLTNGGDQAQASRFAGEWLTSQGVQGADIAASECLFCHSEIANAQVEANIARQGYSIIPLQGC
ncbi:DUF2024 family protein [Metapseudomonas resinovorans]|uniref:DUF2024 domain-containing protein n=1 Tax=Metapseudomonas resinovorans NBRC 106553 TaxID=1245471 RepID=S6AFN7_METRE|nr:DUF2024 family protein [Pseudomonas resinovorans]BAN48837.1 hypothetical protein PCA10_31050 [Pseudomonas resinovorans NBRC 106553]